jgi:uncharacterized protein (DUF58 family)
MIIPAKRCYYLLFFGIAIAILVAIFNNIQFSFLTILLFDLIILSLTIVDGLQSKANQVIVNRYPLQKLSIGREHPVIISVQAKNQQAEVVLKDNYPSAFSVSLPTLQTKLAPHSVEELTYKICPHSRGEFQWGDIQVRQLGKWGLAWYDWQVPASQKVAVYPDLVGLRSLSLRLTLENAGIMRSHRRLSQGTEFSELREYVSGEDTRLIDWKATARRGHPIVRVLEAEREQTLIILLDRGRLMTAQVQGLKRFDWGLNSTLSLALAGLNRGDCVGIGVFDREIITWIPPERGQHQLSKIIERLTPLQPTLLEPDYFGAVTKLVNQQNRRALVVLITDIIDITASAELLAAMERLTPRYLPFCVTLRDSQIDQIAQIKTQTVNDLYQRAVALDLLSQRQVALAKLQQKSVLVLDAPANQISEQLVNRYLQIKARNLL